MITLLKSHLTSGLTLGFIGLIFTTDSLLDFLGYNTFSQGITDWIYAKPDNLYIFLGLVFALVGHFLFTKYHN